MALEQQTIHTKRLAQLVLDRSPQDRTFHAARAKISSKIRLEMDTTIKGESALHAIAQRAETHFQQLLRLHSTTPPVSSHGVLSPNSHAHSLEHREIDMPSLWRDRARALQSRLHALDAELTSLQSRLPIAPAMGERQVVASAHTVSSIQRRSDALSEIADHARNQVERASSALQAAFQLRDELRVLRDALLKQPLQQRDESAEALERIESLRRSNLFLAQSLADFIVTHFPEGPENYDSERLCSLRELFQRLLNARVDAAGSGETSAFVSVRDAHPDHVAWLLRHGLVLRDPSGAIALCSFDL